jgi:hypothetical protein
MPFMADDPDTQVDGLERLTELAKHASPEGRSLERTIAVVAQYGSDLALGRQTFRVLTVPSPEGLG